MWLAGKRRAKRAETVEAEIRYLSDAAERPRLIANDPARTIAPLVQHKVRFHDLRHADEAPSLNREGFTLLPHRSNVTDFSDARQHPIYCQELAQLLRDVTGSSMVFVSPTVVLRSKSHPHYAGGVVADRVADVVHSDRTDRSVWTEARWALAQYGVATPPEGRLVSYNFWRTLTPPPQDFPLALCDLRTVREEKLVRALSIGNPVNRGEEVEFYLSLFDREQRWCYFSNLTRGEVLLFQQYDSAASGPSGCPHTAFRDPAVANAATTRVSIEARAYAFLPS